jgi:hypothetical protein
VPLGELAQRADDAASVSVSVVTSAASTRQARLASALNSLSQLAMQSQPQLGPGSETSWRGAGQALILTPSRTAAAARAAAAAAAEAQNPASAAAAAAAAAMASAASAAAAATSVAMAGIGGTRVQGVLWSPAAAAVLGTPAMTVGSPDTQHMGSRDTGPDRHVVLSGGGRDSIMSGGSFGVAHDASLGSQRHSLRVSVVANSLYLTPGEPRSAQRSAAHTPYAGGGIRTPDSNGSVVDHGGGIYALASVPDSDAGAAPLRLAHEASGGSRHSVASLASIGTELAVVAAAAAARSNRSPGSGEGEGAAPTSVSDASHVALLPSGDGSRQPAAQSRAYLVSLGARTAADAAYLASRQEHLRSVLVRILHVLDARRAAFAQYDREQAEAQTRAHVQAEAASRAQAEAEGQAQAQAEAQVRARDLLDEEADSPADLPNTSALGSGVVTSGSGSGSRVSDVHGAKSATVAEMSRRCPDSDVGCRSSEVSVSTDMWSAPVSASAGVEGDAAPRARCQSGVTAAEAARGNAAGGVARMAQTADVGGLTVTVTPIAGAVPAGDALRRGSGTAVASAERLVLSTDASGPPISSAPVYSPHGGAGAMPGLTASGTGSVVGLNVPAAGPNALAVPGAAASSPGAHRRSRSLSAGTGLMHPPQGRRAAEVFARALAQVKGSRYPSVPEDVPTTPMESGLGQAGGAADAVADAGPSAAAATASGHHGIAVAPEPLSAAIEAFAAALSPGLSGGPGRPVLSVITASDLHHLPVFGLATPVTDYTSSQHLLNASGHFGPAQGDAVSMLAAVAAWPSPAHERLGRLVADTAALLPRALNSPDGGRAIEAVAVAARALVASCERPTAVVPPRHELSKTQQPRTPVDVGELLGRIDAAISGASDEALAKATSFMNLAVELIKS